LRIALAGVNARLAEEMANDSRIQSEADALRQAWRELAGPERVLLPEALAGHSAWLSRIERLHAEVRGRLEELRAEREALAVRVAQAMREVDATDRHKADMRKAFDAVHEKVQFNEAEDHWSILSARSEHVSQA
jgi:chromosome segregation ATPase